MDTREIDMQPARRGWLATHLTAAEAASDRHDLVQAHTERVRARQMGATILAIRVLGEDDGSQAYRKRYLTSYHKWLRYLSGLTAEGLISCLTGLASSPPAALPSGEGATPASPDVTASPADGDSTVPVARRPVEKLNLGGLR